MSANINPIKFTPIQSIFESAFFTKLSELKLNEFKLDATTRPITAFSTNPNKLNKFNDTPVLNFDFESFENKSENDQSNIIYAGQIYNVNTIEEFKELDKQGLLNSWGKEIHDNLTNDSKLTYKDFNRFFIISFSDIKKYKFYYWVAYPNLHTSWTIEETASNPEVNNAKIIESISNPLQFEQFFQLENDNLLDVNGIISSQTGSFVFIDSCLSKDGNPSLQLKNYLFFLAHKGFEEINLSIFRAGHVTTTLKLKLDKETFEPKCIPKVIGWERTSRGKLGPKLADLGLLINPNQLAEQAVDLNLKLMKWRIAPELDLDIIKKQKVLLLGAGTLGSYVSRALMGWGVRDITFVDNGRISYSNPVRQPLFNFKDCFSDNGQGQFKATKAAESLKEIFPGVNAKGYNLEVPMIGHSVTDEEKHKSNFDLLCKLFDENDVIFLLMDSRESRWLPTVLGYAKGKIVMNAALGFDSYLVMRHGSLDQNPSTRVGCYYCNDVVAPNDSLSDRTLDQMCTVTRPGGALMASSLAVELLVSILQHPDHQLAANTSTTKFGDIPHQIRGFLHNFQQSKLFVPNYNCCSACSDPVINKYKEEGWEFVKKCLNSTKYLEEVCGLKKVQEEAEKASEELLNDFEFNDDDEDAEWLE